MKIPDRSVLVGTAVGWLVSAGIAYLGSKGLNVPTGDVAWIVATVTGLVIHFVPDSVQNIIDKLNDSIVVKAMKDPNSDVSYKLPDQTAPRT